MPDTCKWLCSQESERLFSFSIRSDGVRSTRKLKSVHQSHGVGMKLLCIFRYANQKKDFDSVKDLTSEKESGQINYQTLI